MIDLRKLWENAAIECAAVYKSKYGEVKSYFETVVPENVEYLFTVEESKIPTCVGYSVLYYNKDDMKAISNACADTMINFKDDIKGIDVFYTLVEDNDR